MNRAAVFALVIGVATSGCGLGILEALLGYPPPPSPPGCSSDSDCGSGELCRDGACEPLPEVNCGTGDCPLDILFVIDNSGSMLEEQAALAQGIPDVIELLDLDQIDYHIGVISTDMNDCDNPTIAGRPSQPQRGCLQTTGGNAPAVITPDNSSGAEVLVQIIENVMNGGSPYEQGLEAARHFLTADHDVPAAAACNTPRDCAGDLDEFLRDGVERDGETVDVKLLVIFMTDEEDCSHNGRIDETVQGNTALCYSQPDLLEPLATYRDFFAHLKPNPALVGMGLIGGVIDGAASGCKVASGMPSADCDPAQGNSIATCDNLTPSCQPVCSCHMEIDRPESDAQCPGAYFPATNCCEADPAARYFELVSSVGIKLLEPICQQSYRTGLVELVDKMVH